MNITIRLYCVEVTKAKVFLNYQKFILKTLLSFSFINCIFLRGKKSVSTDKQSPDSSEDAALRYLSFQILARIIKTQTQDLFLSISIVYFSLCFLMRFLGFTEHRLGS